MFHPQFISLLRRIYKYEVDINDRLFEIVDDEWWMMKTTTTNKQTNQQKKNARNWWRKKNHRNSDLFRFTSFASWIGWFYSILIEFRLIRWYDTIFHFAVAVFVFHFALYRGFNCYSIRFFVLLLLFRFRPCFCFVGTYADGPKKCTNMFHPSRICICNVDTTLLSVHCELCYCQHSITDKII